MNIQKKLNVMKLAATTLLIILSTAQTILAVDLFVSVSGNDTHPGTKDLPVATLQQAKTLASSYAGNEAVTVHVSDGIYYLPEPLVFTPEDSGTKDMPIVYRAEHEGGAVLSGGTKLYLQWQPFRDGIFQAVTPAGLAIDQLFINGSSQRMARYPNYDANKPTDAYQGFAADAFSKERAARWKNPAGGFIHAMHRSRWGGYHYRITGKDADGEISYEGGWQNNRQMGMHKEFRMVENIIEELDAAGEWFHDAEANTLFYKPDSNTDLNTATVEVVRLRHLVEFQGTLDAPVKSIALQGFVFRHAARTFMDTKEPMLRSDWAIYRGGAVMITGSEDIHILDSEFDQVGGNAIFVNQYNRGTLVKGCHIHDCGASGVCFVGDPAAVRDPLFEYGQKNDLTKIDRTPGPKTENYPANGTVEDCLIHGIGRVERQPAGVQIEMAMAITVRDCSIYDCARAGINVGDGAWGGHLIERCDVFDTVLETHDHGSFNSWGRDRYWRRDHLEASQKAVDADPKLPFLDAFNTTVIRNSRWRCDHGWDIDLDDGSSNYDIYDNLMLQGGLKLREGFGRRVWNNITVNNGFHPHVWFNHSQDMVYSNIFMAAHRGVRTPTATARGKRIDNNLFFSADPKIKDKFVQFGWDVHSIVADPLFIDPAGGDFRVASGSPAFKIGFENFPMDQFGVKKPSLKAIAETPVIPKLEIPGQNAQPSDAVETTIAMDAFWLGATLHALQGEEFSAYGVSKQDGGVALLDVPEYSYAGYAGFQKNDLVLAINQTKIASVEDLITAYTKAGNAPLRVRVVRDQQTIDLQIDNHPYVVIESASTTAGFSTLRLPNAATGKVTANQATQNEPLKVLTDGQLNRDYGPVFQNGVQNGAYKLDLGAVQSVSAITSWSFNQNQKRGVQKLTLFVSNANTDPGWKLSDRSRFTPLGSIDTRSAATEEFTAASLRAQDGKSLGNFRWIVWEVSPVSKSRENTAFQELNVEVQQ